MSYAASGLVWLPCLLLLLVFPRSAFPIKRGHSLTTILPKHPRTSFTAPAGLGPARHKALTQRIKENGGMVYEPPPKLASIFMAASKRKREELPGDLTHIICEEKYDHAHGSRILKDVEVPSLPTSVKVAKVAWVSECLKGKSLLPIEPYIIAEASKVNKDAAAVQNQPEPPQKMQAVGGSSSSAGTSMADWRTVGPAGSVHALKLPGSLTSERVAAFDLDSTLVTTKSGKSFPVAPSDWKWLYPHVPDNLRKLHADGYKVVIISNQGGIAKGKLKVEDMRGRVSQVVHALGFPLEAFCATGDDIYRKPRIGIWQLLSQSNPTDNTKSLFVGDAAGRPAMSSRKKDFSASDVMFAVNAKIDFHTPEEFFLDAKEKIHSGASQKTIFSVRPLDAFVDRTSNQNPPAAMPAEQEAVLLIGPPAVGKSTYCKTKLPHHAWINQDTLKRRERCQEQARLKLEAGESVVIDATNRDRAVRKEWVSLFRNAMGPKGRVRFIVFALPVSVAFHLNIFRSINPASKEPRRVPDPVIYKAYKDMEVVKPDEGYDELQEVRQIVPGPFQTQEEEQLFFMHLKG